MVGREVNAIYRGKPLAPGEELMRVEVLESRRPLLEDIASRSGRAKSWVWPDWWAPSAPNCATRCSDPTRPARGRSRWPTGADPVYPRARPLRGLALIPEDRQRAGLAKDSGRLQHDAGRAGLA